VRDHAEVILGGVRTPFGTFGGAFWAPGAVRLGVVAALEHSGTAARSRGRLSD
jgi:hypothetical protein